MLKITRYTPPPPPPVWANTIAGLSDDDILVIRAALRQTADRTPGSQFAKDCIALRERIIKAQHPELS